MKFMIKILEKIFIKNKYRDDPAKYRNAVGVLCGILGIILNIVLFAGKLLASLISGSIAMAADAFNNLSDAASSLISIIGFKLSGQKPDAAHPFGHGRIEYISGLIVSMLIIIMGVELCKSSVEKIFHPSELEFGIAPIIILAVSIAVKIYMCLYNFSVGKKISSQAMTAIAREALGDCFSTSAVLVCTLISAFTSVNLDAYCGTAVSLFIIYAGIRSAVETISTILGKPPTEELVGEIEKIVTSHGEICGIHDLVVHDYGPGRMMVTLHVEVPADSDFSAVHDTVDNIERELEQRLGCEATIHMDPIETDNEKTRDTRNKIAELVKIIDERVTVHDFRMVAGPTHTNVIFDVVVPYGVKRGEDEIKRDVQRMVKSLDENYYAVIKIDKSYVR